jgi:hypothetical protein
MIDRNPPPNALIATTDAEHRYNRFCAEWDLFPSWRESIKADIERNPQWRIEVANDLLIFSGTRSIGPSPTPALNQTPQRSNLSLMKELAAPIRVSRVNLAVRGRKNAD